MTVYDGLFPMGLGTGRLPVKGAEDAAGIEKSAELVLRALEAGVNYIDTNYTYSCGMAYTVLKEAFARTTRPFSVTTKVKYGSDTTADDVRRRVETALEQMGLERIPFFLTWSVMNDQEFERIMEKGGEFMRGPKN